MKKEYIIVFIGYVLINIVLFHEILSQYSDMIRGDVILFQDEFTPYFDLRTQYIDNIFSTYDHLIDREEIRTEYYFITGWSRYYTILPMMLIFLNAIAGYMMWYSTYILFTKFCIRDLNIENCLCIFLATLPSYLFLMYSKITHFYSIIFGFGMFCLAISIYIINMKKIVLKDFVIIVILLFFNPAIHYIFLFVPIITIITIFFILTCRYDIRGIYSKVKYYLLLTSAILIPKYMMFKALSFESIQQTAPISYLDMLQTSIYPALKNLSLESTAAINIVIYDMNYLPHNIYYIFILFSILSLFSLLLSRYIKYENLIVNVSVLLFLMGFSFSMGPKFFFSYYKYMYHMIDYQYIGNVFLSYLHVLRYPQRWQFLEYYSMIFLMSSVFINIYQRVTGYSHYIFIKKLLIISFITILMVGPFIANDRYRHAFISGNYNGFLEPYTIPKDIKNIKDIIQKHDNDNGRLMILPSADGSVRLKSLNNTLYSYNDAIYIYYFNIPSIDIGLISSNTSKKMLGFLMLYSIKNLDNKLFYKLLIDNNISKIFIHNDIERRNLDYFGTYLKYLSPEEYFNNLNYIIEKLQKEKKIKVEYSSDNYSLIFIVNSTNNENSTNVDMKSIDKTLNMSIELYKNNEISFSALSGIRKDDMSEYMSGMYNTNPSDIYFYQPNEQKSNDVISSSIVMAIVPNIMRYYITSNSQITGTYGAIDYNYLVLYKKGTYVEYDVKIPEYNNIYIYIRSTGNIQVIIFDDDKKICEKELVSDTIKNSYICNIDSGDIKSSEITIRFLNLKILSAIDDIILLHPITDKIDKNIEKEILI